MRIRILLYFLEMYFEELFPGSDGMGVKASTNQVSEDMSRQKRRRNGEYDEKKDE